MPSENLAGRTIAGYRLLERVGEGGTAEVYRAEHPERGPCAFKVLRQRLRGDPTAVKRFLREAGYRSRGRPPGVVRTYDYGEADGLYYLPPQGADGNSLAHHVHPAGAPAPAPAGGPGRPPPRAARGGGCPSTCCPGPGGRGPGGPPASRSRRRSRAPSSRGWPATRPSASPQSRRSPTSWRPRSPQSRGPRVADCSGLSSVSSAGPVITQSSSRCYYSAN